MAVMGDLVVNMGLNSRGFTSGITKAQSGLSKFGSMASSFLNPITAGFAAVTAGAATAGVAVYMFAGRLANLADVADKATQTGLSGAFIQRLGYAADQSGVSVETLMGGIKKLTVLIGKGDSKPFEKLGINLATLKTLAPEKQFLTIAAAISKLPTAADRAAAAVKIFGKTGIEMTGLFAGGMDNLNTLLADAEALGIGISAEGLAKAAAADDAIQRMKASFGALLDQVTVGVAPAFELVATAIADMIPPVTKFFDKFNGLDDKAQWIGDVLIAGMDVGIETIKEHWATMLTDMVNMAADGAKQIALNMVPGASIVKWGAENAFGGEGEKKQSGLAAARGRLDEVMGRLGPDDHGLIRGKLPAMGGKPETAPVDGSKLSALAGGLAESAKGLFDQAALAAQSKLTDLQIKGGYAASVVGSMFGVGGDKSKPPEEAAKQETKFAGAMQKGSAEAYSTIVQAMTRAKDPNVTATEKQTMQLVKAMKSNKPGNFFFVPEFAT